MKNIGKSTLREIKSSFGRFVAILAIIALGVGFFAGLKVTRAAMLTTMKEYLDGASFYDFRLLSTVGLDEEAVDSFQSQEFVEVAEGVVSMDVLYLLDGREGVIKTFSLPKEVNMVKLTAGRLPQCAGECVADSNMLGETAIGSVITLSKDNDEDTLDCFSCNTYTIVGLVQSPLYIQFERGNTVLGTGRLDGFVYLTTDGFDTDYYTDVYVRFAQNNDLYGDGYTDYIKEKRDDWEDLTSQTADRRYQSILSEAEDKISDAEQELADKKADGEQELADAKQELADARDEIADGEHALADARDEIADGWQAWQDGSDKLLDAEEALADGRTALAKNARILEKNEKKLTDGHKALIEGKKELKKNEEKLKKGQQAIEENEQSIKKGEKELVKNEKKLKKSQDALEKNQKKLDKSQETIEGNQKKLDRNREILDEKQKTLNDNRSVLDGQQKDLDEQKQTLEAGSIYMEPQAFQVAKGKLDAAQVELDTAKAKLNAAQIEIDAAEKELNKNQKELDTAKMQLKTGVNQLNAAQAELEAGQKEFEAAKMKLEAGKSELEAAKTEFKKNKADLGKAKKELDASFREWKTAWKKVQSAKKELEAAEEEIGQKEKELKRGKTELKDKKKELEDGEQELKDKKKELKDAKKKLEDGECEYREAVEEFNDKVGEAEEKLKDARKEVEDLEKPDTYVLGRDTNIGYACFENDSDIVEGIAVVFPVFFFLVAALVCITTMNRMVEEQRTQIGVLKALGYGNMVIMSKYMVYSGLAAVIGCIFGFLLGTWGFPKVIWFAYGIMYQTEPIKYIFDWKLAFFSLLVALLCSVGTTWLSCRVELAEVAAQLMRPKAPKAGKRVFLERIPFVWRRLSFLRKVSVRNIFRYKKRLFMMVIGISGCTALLVTGFGIKDSIADVADRQFEDIQIYDISVTFKQDVDEEMEEKLGRLSGTGLSDFLCVSEMNMDLVSERGTKSVYLVTADAGQIGNYIDMHTARKTVIEYPKTGEGVITKKLAEQYGIKTGDIVMLRDEDLRTLEVRISAVMENYIYNYIYITAETWKEAFGYMPERKTAYINVGEETDVHALAAEIMDLEGVSNVTVNQDTVTRLDNMMSSLNIIVVVVILCAAGLAFIVLYNLTNINITERIREIATIKVLGFYKRETASYVFRENLLLTFLGMFLGLGLGKLLHAFVMSKVQVDLIAFDVRVRLISYLYSALLTIGFAWVVNLGMGGKLEGISMTESLKSVD